MQGLSRSRRLSAMLDPSRAKLFNHLLDRGGSLLVLDIYAQQYHLQKMLQDLRSFPMSKYITS